MTPDIAEMLLDSQFEFWLSILPLLLGAWLLKRLIFD